MFEKAISLTHPILFRWMLAIVIAALAIIRKIFVFIFWLIAVTAFILAVAACLQNVGLFYVPFAGQYLEEVSVDASVTLLGILIGVYGATAAWRMQKRDEILLASLYEVQEFFEAALRDSTQLNGYINLLKELQLEVKAGPYTLASYYRAHYLGKNAEDMREKLSRFLSSGVAVHTLDGRNIQMMASHPRVFDAFKLAKSGLLDLIDAAHMFIPSSTEDAHEFITYLRFLPDQEFDKFLSEFDRLNIRVGGAVGGIRGAINARYFPPTITFARALLNLEKNP